MLPMVSASVLGLARVSPTNFGFGDFGSSVWLEEEEG